MKNDLRDTRNPTYILDISRKRTLLNLNLSTSLFLTMMLCEQVLVMALPLPSPSFNFASSLAEVASKNHAVGITDATKSLDTVKSTDGVLAYPRVAGHSFRDDKFEDVERLGTITSTDDALRSKKILDPIAGSSPNIKDFGSDTLKSKDFAKMDDGSGIGKEGLSPASLTDKSKLPGNQIPPEDLGRFGKLKSSRFLNWIANLKNWSKKIGQSFSNLIERMKGKPTPLKDTILQSKKNPKQTLGPVKTTVKPNRIKLAQFVLKRLQVKYKSKYKDLIKGRAEKAAYRKQQKAVTLHEIAQDWFRTLPPPRSPQPRRPKPAAKPPPYNYANVVP